MKKLADWIIGGLIFLTGFIAAILVMQPKINKLKKQVATLQKNNTQLLERCSHLQAEFHELLVQHKALKALHFKKKAESKGRMQENLMMQYAIRDYLELLIKRVKHQQKFDNDEKLFFNAFEGVIDGSVLSASEKVRVKEYVTAHHKADIEALKECDFTLTLNALNECPC